MRSEAATRGGIMAWLLRAATVVSTALLAAGMVLALFAPRMPGANALLTAGLVILMITPVTTLLTAMAGEAAEGDWRFVAIGGVVIALLAGSLVVAFL